MIFKTLPPLTKIRVSCLFNTIISTIFLLVYIWLDASFQNKIDTVVLVFTMIIFMLVSMFFVRIVLVKAEAYGKAQDFFITKDGKVYQRELLFLQFPTQFLLVSIVLTQLAIPSNLIVQSFIFGAAAFIIVTNIYYFVHLPWIYRNSSHLKLPDKSEGG